MYQIVSATDTKPPTCFNYIHMFYPYVICSKTLHLQYLLLIIQIPIAMPKNSHLQHSVVGQALFTLWQPGLPQLIPGDLQLKRKWGVSVDCMWYLLQVTHTEYLLPYLLCSDSAQHFPALRMLRMRNDRGLENHLWNIDCIT